MANLVVVELLDGSWLGMDTRGADRSVERELEIWALVPPDQERRTTRSGPSWDDVLEAGPLLLALRSRTITDAARNTFDGTVRHLTAWWSAEHPLLTPEEVVARVRRVCRAARESPADHDLGSLRCGAPIREEDGGWTVEVESWVAHCAADGLITVLRPACAG